MVAVALASVGGGVGTSAVEKERMLRHGACSCDMMLFCVVTIGAVHLAMLDDRLPACRWAQRRARVCSGCNLMVQYAGWLMNG